jgi:hypothetical protein
MRNRLFSGSLFALVVMLGVRIATRAQTAKQPPHDESIAVGAQYDSTHVYIALAIWTRSSRVSSPRLAARRPNQR